jgi:glycosyltransferase involved in cell wall biosynthesis
MSKKTPKVLIVATSRKTRGGITSVVKAHELGEQWKKYHCRWIETHRDGNVIRKLRYLAFALFQYIVLLPSYDIVHLHLSTLLSARRKMLFVRVAKLFHKKVILHFHASPEAAFEQNPSIYRKLFSQANLILVLSNHVKLWIEQNFGTFDIKVIYNPCNNVKKDNNACRKKEILFAGILNHNKGYADLIRAFALISEKHPDWTLVFAGNGEIEQARMLARKLCIDKQTIFLGWIKGEEKDKVFSAASIFCLPSYLEGFPMAVLDAWAYGIPCVTTPVGGIPDIVTDGVNGLLFPVGDVNSLSKQLEKLMDNEELRKSIVQETDKMVLRNLSVDIINSKLDTIYNSLINNS